MAVESARQVVVWVPPNERPEAVEAARRKQDMAELRQAEAAARKAIAERRMRQAQIHEVSERLVLTQLEKLLRLAQSPDFADSPGPIDLKDVIKLAELAHKDYRLDTGQATANVAYTVGPSIDFAKLSQEERDQWRALAAKGGGEE